VCETGWVLELRDGHGLWVFLLGWVIVRDMHMWLLGCGKVCAFSHCPSAFCILRFRLFSCLLLSGITALPYLVHVCGCVESVGATMASSEAMDGDEAFQSFVRRCAGCWAWLWVRSLFYVPGCSAKSDGNTEGARLVAHLSMCKDTWR